MYRNSEVAERREKTFRPMASDGISSISRRSGSGGGGRQDQFAASSVPNGKEDKDGVSPKHFCGLNEHIARLGITDTRYLGEKEIGDVEEYHWKQDMKNRITYLEKRIIVLEMKKKLIRWCMCVIFIVLSVAVLSCKN
ncbi:hypothetical protein Ahy_B07g087614 [Arachis hypogaea]|uniref:Uncharacterized protein n=1 Tax=Arachis hypogaea TaxID=3818 RepID=A0A444YCJ5_ARAHY|nr:hypothetical protein Ahy_B07g087614 [Arachis hypogaea]